MPVVLPVRVGARAVSGGRDALLGEFGNAPVLEVRGVPELHGAARIEALAGKCVPAEQPVATDRGAVRREWAHQVAHHVVRVKAEHHVREQDVVTHAPPAGLGKARQRRSHETSVGGHRLDPLRHVHCRTDGAGGHRVVLAAQVVGEALELGMDDGAVQTFGEVLDDQLPVGLQVVALGVGGAELADSPRLEAGRGRAELLQQFRPVVRHPHEDDPAPLLAPRRRERSPRPRTPSRSMCGARRSPPSRP